MIIQHPSAPVVLRDPRDPFVVDKYDTAPTFDPRTEDQCVRRDGVDAVTLLVDLYGLQTVQSWLRNIAALQGHGCLTAAEGSK